MLKKKERGSLSNWKAAKTKNTMTCPNQATDDVKFQHWAVSKRGSVWLCLERRVVTNCQNLHRYLVAASIFAVKTPFLR